MVHWDHVCCGTPHPCCAHGLLCAEKQRWQVCRYAIATAAATRHVLHGKRSVSLWPGLGPFAASLQEGNQNSTHEMSSTLVWLCYHQKFKGTVHTIIRNTHIFSSCNANYPFWLFWFKSPSLRNICHPDVFSQMKWNHVSTISLSRYHDLVTQDNPQTFHISMQKEACIYL